MLRREGAPLLPVGIVTFLLTDIVGSSRLWERDPETARRAIIAHRRLIDAAVAARGGARPQEQGEGDSTLSAFADAADACAAALDIQRMLSVHADTAGMLIRTAVHTGEAQLLDERNYLAAEVNRCARLRALAHPGQILVSRRAWELAHADLEPEFEMRDLGMHRLKDLARPEHVFEIRRTDSRRQFPPLSSLDSVRNNLPVQLTSFIGRDDEVRELVALVSRTRLMTLTGSGGCGKTRLSLQVAADVVSEFPDGVWFVDLAPVRDGDQVAAEVANALLLQPGPLQSSLETLLAYLSGRRMLILLDNCEHLLDACAGLVDGLLRDCPAISLLATSREPLGVPGEVVRRVPSLSTGSIEKVTADGGSLMQFEAPRLFFERAAQARADLSCDPATVADICRHLDGIPLAIELAAARVRVLTPPEILAAVQKSLQLLTGGARTALPRQQTLEASIDWSYSLLSEREQLLLERLAVFRGFTLLDVEQVCGVEPLHRQDVLSLLGSLVDKSLVQSEADGSTSRYRMLETIREFATRRLVQRAEVGEMLARHAHRFLELLRDSQGRLEEGDITRLNQLARESDNLRAAVEWALQVDARCVLHCALPLAILSRATGRGEETTAWLDAALSAVSEDEPELRATALYAKAVIAAYKIDVLAVLPVAVESHALFAELHHEQGLARSSVLTGFARTCLGDSDAGLAEIEFGVETARRLGDRFSLRLALLARGYCLMHQDMDRGRECLEAYIQMHESEGAADVALARAFQSWCDLQQGRWRSALARAADASRLAREQHQRQALAIALVNHAEALLHLGKLDDVRPLVVEAERICLETQDIPAYAILLALRCRLELAEGDTAAACESGHLSVSLLGGTAPQFTCFLQLALARAQFEHGDEEVARATLDEAWQVARSYDLSWPLATAAYLHARALLRQGCLAAAHESALVALARYERIDAVSGLIVVLELMAEIALRLQRPHEAVRLLAASQGQRERTEFAVYPLHHPARDLLVTELRSCVAAEFDAEWSAGIAMDLTPALALARDKVRSR